MSKDPKELLARWASDEILDPFGPVLNNRDEPAKSTTSHEIPAIRNTNEKALPQLAKNRSPSDQAETMAETTSSMGIAPSVTAAETDSTHGNLEIMNKSTEKEHHELEPPLAEKTTRQTATEAPSGDGKDDLVTPASPGGSPLLLIGQILSYAGVLSLTLGTTFVLWGYFGDRPNYAPMGWLVLTAGQMLLFLGVITLVSGGMEQTTAEVTQRIDALGEHILRIENNSARQCSEEQLATPSARPISPSSQTGFPPEAAA